MSLYLRRDLWVVLILLAALIMGLSLTNHRRRDITALTARKVEKTIGKRMAMLEGYMRETMETDLSEWPELKGLPSDMVVYRYVNDSLKSWNNQFTLDNDDISQKVFVQRFSNLRYNVVSPLSQADTSVAYMNLGPCWYLVKSMEDGQGKQVIGGLMIRNTLASSYNGVNDRLKLTDRFAVYPISYSGGSTVFVEGIPQFKIIQENASVAPLIPRTWAIWLAVFMILTGVQLLLYRKRTRARALLAASLVTVTCLGFFLLGYSLHSSVEMFSPTVFADGGLLYSLGAVIIVNLWFVAVVTCFFHTRDAWLRHALARRTRTELVLYAMTMVIFLGIMLWYAHSTFRSLIVNSNINLELFRVGDISMMTVYVYLSFFSILVAVALLLQQLSPVLRKLTGLRYNVFTMTGRLILSVLGAAYLLFMASSLSLSREEGRAEIWANRLAVDRNLVFEIQLRQIEAAIAGDGLIPSLIALDRDFQVIINRINESYLSRITNEYDVDLYMFRDQDADAAALRFFNERIQNGTPLADNSRFIYSRSAVGRSQYTGVFTYYNPAVGVVRLLIAIESKAESEGKGYDAIMGVTRSGTVALPPNYSYAKYLNGQLVGYTGDYAYPTIFSGKLRQVSDSLDMRHVTIDNYLHFVMPVSDDEYVAISRKSNDATKYMVAAIMLMLLAFCVLSLPRLGSHRPQAFQKNYYKQRINSLLFFSLIAVLVAMVSVSMLFILRRNNSNLNDLMAGKINTIQSLVEAESRYFQSPMEFTTTDFNSRLDNIGTYTKSDISLFSTEGKVITSTFPEIFSRLTIGTRLNDEAYENVIYNNKRYYIHKEKIDGRGIYTMSAPVFNADGKMLAIVSAPYTDTGLGFRNDALFHASFVITIFFILLLLTLFLSARVVDKMFRPLIDMGWKMKQATTTGLEYIFYDRDDEISTLVDSYNRMVHDLSESSKQAAQLERDKAWSEMARQVAHEIKNPLTPIKLQIQRIIRLKSKNDPSWQEKFDSIVNVVMDSIDQLTDTANEFSTFAKLYSEEPVDINLDSLATDEVALFGDRENISIQYIGLQNSWISGPKPQLTRVFVNLLTNSVQAIEGAQREAAEDGREVPKGEIMLSIRNSNRDGFYDIVFEDNGPGVKDENRAHLFTPNFTTKSSGTGLGLAICKNIIDRCGGDITYSRSFTLGGACFTIRYPKN